ncbi:MAG: DUF3014 domain-containing protein [Pseudomonadota bacterium]
MNRGTWAGLIIGVLVLAAGAYYYWTKDRGPRVFEPPPVTEATPTPTPTAQIEYPLPSPTMVPEAAKPLPPLDESDEEVVGSLGEVFGEPPVEAFLIPDRVVRRLVAFVDSLDGEALRLKQRPVPRLDGTLIVDKRGDELYLDPANFERYEAIVSAIEAAEAERIVAFYLRYYPLMQKAYAEQGYPDRYFNDRVVAIIDHLLATPVVEPPIRLVQPKVFYEFADPQLEALSSGRKLLIRIGPDNAAIVKQKLHAIRKEIVAAAPSG